MSKTDRSTKSKTAIKKQAIVFIGYSPIVKQLTVGGYRVSFLVSSIDWDNIKGLMSPESTQKLFTVVVQGEQIK